MPPPTVALYGVLREYPFCRTVTRPELPPIGRKLMPYHARITTLCGGCHATPIRGWKPVHGASQLLRAPGFAKSKPPVAVPLPSVYLAVGFQPTIMRSQRSVIGVCRSQRSPRLIVTFDVILMSSCA